MVWKKSGIGRKILEEGNPKEFVKYLESHFEPFPCRLNEKLFTTMFEEQYEEPTIFPASHRKTISHLQKNGT